jgi:ATP-dependent Lhr-like helicase
LATILQTGGLTASAAYRLLCARGAFRTIDKKLFAELLRSMAAPERRLIEQTTNGLLMIGSGGERLTESHEFYSVFETEQDDRILHDGRVLGAYPASSMIAPRPILDLFGSPLARGRGRSEGQGNHGAASLVRAAATLR